MTGDDLTENVVATLTSRRRWWSIGEIVRAVDAPRPEVRDELERLVDTGRVGRQQIRGWFKPVYGASKGVPR